MLKLCMQSVLAHFIFRYSIEVILMLILETVYDVIVTYAPRYGFWPSWPPSPYLARVKL